MERGYPEGFPHLGLDLEHLNLPAYYSFLGYLWTNYGEAHLIIGLPFLPEHELGVNFSFLIGPEGDLMFEDIQLIGKWLAPNY